MTQLSVWPIWHMSFTFITNISTQLILPRFKHSLHSLLSHLTHTITNLFTYKYPSNTQFTSSKPTIPLKHSIHHIQNSTNKQSLLPTKHHGKRPIVLDVVVSLLRGEERKRDALRLERQLPPARDAPAEGGGAHAGGGAGARGLPRRGDQADAAVWRHESRGRALGEEGLRARAAEQAQPKALRGRHGSDRRIGFVQ